MSPVGLNAAQSCASIRAGINRFGDCDDFVCEPAELDFDDPEPMVGARVRGLDGDDSRIPQLALLGLDDLIQSSGLSRTELSSSNVCVALPPPGRTGSADAGPEPQVREFLESAAGSRIPNVQIFATGHVAGLDALGAAVASLDSGEFRTAIVLAVDSFHDPETLEWLDAEGRLRSTRNRDGFIPGEACAALLLESAASAGIRGAGGRVRIDGYGTASEADTFASGQPSSGSGLSTAIQTAIQAAGGAPLGWSACDLNGERYRSYEWGLVRGRLHSLFSDPSVLWHPADCTGDVGAASGGVLAAMVSQAFRRGYAPSDRVLVWASADDGRRVALTLSADDAAVH